MVELMVEFESVMTYVCGRYDAQYSLAAAGSEPGTALVNFSSDLHGASLMDQSNKNSSQTREIKIVRLDELCNKLKLKGPYFIKVDV